MSLFKTLKVLRTGKKISSFIRSHNLDQFCSFEITSKTNVAFKDLHSGLYVPYVAIFKVRNGVRRCSRIRICANSIIKLAESQGRDVDKVLYEVLHAMKWLLESNRDPIWYPETNTFDDVKPLLRRVK